MQMKKYLNRNNILKVFKKINIHKLYLLKKKRQIKLNIKFRIK